MSRNATPLQLFETQMEFSMMLVEAQSVIAMRMMRWGGLWSVTHTENQRMIS